YLRILSVAGLLAPLSVISFNLVKVCDDGNMIFRIEFIKKLIATAILAITIPISVPAIAWGQVAIFVSDMTINCLTAKRYLPEWRLWSRAKDALPYLAVTGLMVGFVWGLGVAGAALSVPLWCVFVSKILLGAGFYALLSELLHLEAWRELKDILLGYLPRRKK
ncbi:MAG: hypothetical protein IKT30_08390, partial [Bacteroidaceae bacterium]|nr:hypothetical protein [Bacteroidaceae bacterium]